MFERYTEKARRAVFFARYEASEYGSPTMETEHFLLGILREDKVLTNRLLPLGSAESIRKEIESNCQAQKKISTSVDLPVSNESKRVLAYAAEEAASLSHQHIGCEHLLLGLLREEKCFAARLLREHNLHLAQAREQIKKLESETRTASHVPTHSLLAELGRDLTREALAGNLPPLVGRERELQQVTQVLCRYSRANPVLVGEHGVGRKTIVYGLTKLIAEGAIPKLAGRSMVSLDFAVISSGMKSRNRFEENLEKIILELHGEHGLILFIEGLHSLAQTQPFLSMANVIKPSLLEGWVQCISTATPAQYAKTVESTPWLERLFTVVEVKPATEAEAIEVLVGTRERLQKFHGVVYTDEAIQYAVFHSASCFPRQYLPEKALDLMDEAGARVKLRFKEEELPEEIRQSRKRVRSIRQRHDKALENNEFEKARFYSDELKKEEQNLESLRKKYNLSDPTVTTVTREDIEHIVAERIGRSPSGGGPVK